METADEETRKLYLGAHSAWQGRPSLGNWYGHANERDAVLVDTFLSEQHAKELLDWVIESGKNLTTIYVTHAHGDHFFGLKHLLDKFLMQRQSALSANSPFWLGVDTGYASLAASSSQANSSSRSGM